MWDAKNDATQQTAKYSVPVTRFNDKLCVYTHSKHWLYSRCFHQRHEKLSLHCNFVNVFTDALFFCCSPAIRIPYFPKICKHYVRENFPEFIRNEDRKKPIVSILLHKIVMESTRFFIFLFLCQQWKIHSWILFYASIARLPSG